jgi:hypothetical protein
VTGGDHSETIQGMIERRLRGRRQLVHWLTGSHPGSREAMGHVRTRTHCPFFTSLGHLDGPIRYVSGNWTLGVAVESIVQISW